MERKSQEFDRIRKQLENQQQPANIELVRHQILEEYYEEHDKRHAKLLNELDNAHNLYMESQRELEDYKCALKEKVVLFQVIGLKS